MVMHASKTYVAEDMAARCTDDVKPASEYWMAIKDKVANLLEEANIAPPTPAEIALLQRLPINARHLMASEPSILAQHSIFEQHRPVDREAENGQQAALRNE